MTFNEFIMLASDNIVKLDRCILSDRIFFIDIISADDGETLARMQAATDAPETEIVFLGGL